MLKEAERVSLVSSRMFGGGQRLAHRRANEDRPRHRVTNGVGLRSDAHGINSSKGSDLLDIHHSAWNESQRGEVAQQFGIIITHTLHDDLLPRQHRRERLTARHNDSTHSITKRIAI